MIADAIAVVGLVQKGIAVLSALNEARRDVTPAITALKETLVDKKQVTQADIDAASKKLDDLMDEFNADI